MPRVFIAGASGVIGRALVQKLRTAGYPVAGATRTRAGAEALGRIGAEPIVMDALDAGSVDEAIRSARPEIVIEQLTALPKHYTPASMRAALDGTIQVRVVGGANLQAAAERHGVRRYLAQSGCYFYAPGETPADETEPFVENGPPLVAGNVRSLSAIEDRVLSSRIEGITLRYGFFYGPSTWYAADGDVAQQVRERQFPVTGNGAGVWPFVHIDDAVDATIAAITTGEPGPYNIADDEQLTLATWLPAYAAWLGAPPPPHAPVDPTTDPDALYYATRLRAASSAKAKRLLGFAPRARDWV
ncbi:MAG: NAD(P)-dependent oxidoreductase [Kofleriaceae bacterium]|nr:NAD(P)-dependent oxidoreductase [Kofleriaceae bacterium]